jgi:hypothetical protein
MKVSLFAVFDVASGVYDGPVGSNTDATAIRQFTQMAINAETPIGKNPEDFSLVKVGRWDDAKGEIEPVDRVTVITANEAIARHNVVSMERREASA